MENSAIHILSLLHYNTPYKWNVYYNTIINNFSLKKFKKIPRIIFSKQWGFYTQLYCIRVHMNIKISQMEIKLEPGLTLFVCERKPWWFCHSNDRKTCMNLTFYLKFHVFYFPYFFSFSTKGHISHSILFNMIFFDVQLRNENYLKYGDIKKKCVINWDLYKLS